MTQLLTLQNINYDKARLINMIVAMTMIATLTSGVDPINFIPWGFTLLSVLIAVYSIVKNNAKDDKKESKDFAIDMTTVITKLEMIQQTVNKTSDNVTSIQGEIKSLEHRVTVIETTLGLENNDGR